MPRGFFFLGAEVESLNADTIPDFTSPSSRNRHDRLSTHFGTEGANQVALSDWLGDLPAGTTLEATLRYLSDLISFHESIIGGVFRVDAWTEEYHYFWRDRFNRIVNLGLGSPDGVHTHFGTFAWQRSGSHFTRYDPDGTLYVSVDGTQAEFQQVALTDVAEFIGYPTFADGEFWASIYTFRSDRAEWTVSFHPWRDDVSPTLAAWLRA